jgi:hypothetical protein
MHFIETRDVLDFSIEGKVKICKGNGINKIGVLDFSIPCVGFQHSINSILQNIVPLTASGQQSFIE